MTTTYLLGAETILRDGDLDALMPFYGGLFDRLPREARHTGGIGRILVYQSRVDADSHRHRFAIEVDSLDDQPSDLTAWTLDDRTEWLWHDTLRDGRVVGEFRDDGAEWCLSGLTYLGLAGQPSAGDGVEIADYDPGWPERYAALAAELRACLPAGVLLGLEHYGSTAVPGLPAKPVIDVLVEVPDFDIAKRALIPRLAGEACEAWWYDDHLVFIGRAGLGGVRTHHLHVAPRGHRVWQGLAFRDRLRADVALANEYAQLKRGLAAAHGNDRERYTAAKGEFVRRWTVG
ncbi:MAG: GrpB family protein [Armatimonadetes bacterium]|nr:GrpB family protein [Armatimonadota bacterium]